MIQEKDKKRDEDENTETGEERAGRATGIRGTEEEKKEAARVRTERE
jgi:hypothetical protein